VSGEEEAVLVEKKTKDPIGSGKWKVNECTDETEATSLIKLTNVSTAKGGSSSVVELLTHNAKFQGSNPEGRSTVNDTNHLCFFKYSKSLNKIM